MARRISKVIKVYGGTRKELNDAVKGWLDTAGYMYYPCEGIDDPLYFPKLVKRELGGYSSDTVVQKGKKSIVVEGVHERYKLDMYEYLGIHKDHRV